MGAPRSPPTTTDPRQWAAPRHGRSRATRGKTARSDHGGTKNSGGDQQAGSRWRPNTRTPRRRPPPVHRPPRAPPPAVPTVVRTSLSHPPPPLPPRPPLPLLPQRADAWGGAGRTAGTALRRRGGTAAGTHGGARPSRRGPAEALPRAPQRRHTARARRAGHTHPGSAVGGSRREEEGSNWGHSPSPPHQPQLRARQPSAFTGGGWPAAERGPRPRGRVCSLGRPHAGQSTSRRRADWWSG